MTSVRVMMSWTLIKHPTTQMVEKAAGGLDLAQRLRMHQLAQVIKNWFYLITTLKFASDMSR